MIDKWLTIEQIADHLQVSREKLYKMCQQGKMPASKFGGQCRFSKDVVDQWMLKSQVDVTKSKPKVAGRKAK